MASERPDAGAAMPLRLALFFTFGVSLATWRDRGLLSREMRLYEALNSRGVHLTLVTYGDDTDREIAAAWPDVEILPFHARVPKLPGWPLQVLVSLLLPLVFRRALARADVFKTNQIFGGWVAVLAGWLCRRPVIARGGYEYYAFTLHQRRGALRRWFAWATSWLTYRKARLVSLATAADAAFAAEHFGIDPERIRLNPNWIDTEHFAPPGDDAPAVAEEADRVLFVGRLSAQKNLALLLRAAARGGFGVDLIGDGEEARRLKALAGRTSADVRFFGRIANDSLPALIVRYPVFALTSDYEGHPKALLEAMACGRAVVVTDAPGLAEVVEDGVSGLIVRPDEAAVAAAIRGLLGDPARRRDLGAAARARVVASGSLSAAVTRELAWYREVLDGETPQ